MRPQGAMEYYTDQTRPEFQKLRSITTKDLDYTWYFLLPCRRCPNAPDRSSRKTKNQADFKWLKFKKNQCSYFSYQPYDTDPALGFEYFLEFDFLLFGPGDPKSAEENALVLKRRRTVPTTNMVFNSVVDSWHFGTDPGLRLMDPDPETAIFVLDLQDANKKLPGI